VFEKEFVGAQMAFVKAVNDVNRKQDMRLRHALLADVHAVAHDDSFSAAKRG